MEFTNHQRRQITIWLIVLFIILFIDRWWNDMLLYQMQPAFFYTRMDVTSWLFMYSGIHKWLLANPTGGVIFDSLFVLFPLVYLLLFIYRPRLASRLAWLWIVFNFIYIQCYTLYPTNSIEAHLAWMLLPFLFTCTTLKGFYLSFRFLRYFFLWFMASAGLWKIWQHGLFNYDEMSAIIYMQHKEFLITSPQSFLSVFYYWLIQHSTVGYLFYVASGVIELVFITGFFTRRFDKWLVVFYFIFFLMDILVMRIKYWEMAPFIVTLCYSRFTMPNVLKPKTRML